MTDQTASKLIPLPLLQGLAAAAAAGRVHRAGRGDRRGHRAPQRESDPARDPRPAAGLLWLGDRSRRALRGRGATEHHGNEFALLIGPSAKARKGSSWDHVQRIFAQVDPEAGPRERIVSGLSSGEGLIWSVRDPDSER